MKITEKDFGKFSKDIIDYVSKYIDTSNAEKNYKETKYFLLKKSLYIDENNNKNFIYPYTGVTKYNYLEGIKIKCLVRDLPNDQESLKNTIFHELMHVASFNYEKLENENILMKFGLDWNIIKNDINKLERKYNYINEAMTEFTAKFIYDKLYDTKYKITKCVVNNKKTISINSIYQRQYFLIAYLLYNYFEKHQEELFEIYFNNNLKLFKKVLKENTDFNLKSLNRIMKIFYQNPYNFKIERGYKNIIRKLNEKNAMENIDIIRQFYL